MIKLLLFVGFSLFGDLSPADSIGIETINGKTFIIHKVDEKETLFAISRRYGSSVDAIVQYNPTVSSGLEIGQILKVPYTPKQKIPADASLHKVAPKETLFSISKVYGITIDELRQWNKLTDNALVVGQELIIKKKKNTATNTQSATAVKNTPGVHTVNEKETMYSIARQYGVTVDQLKTWNNLETNELKIGQLLNVAGPSTQNTQTVKQAPPVVQANENTTVVRKDPPEDSKTDQAVKNDQQPVKTEQTITISESVRNGDEIVETGLAELIEGTDGNRKYLALHRSAPVGTILKVRNEMNNREVFVRVMGKLPDTALTNKVVIRISKSAYERLAAIDSRFRVEVTYYK
jgi:LysM repeat protein